MSRDKFAGDRSPEIQSLKCQVQGFPGGSVVKNLDAMAGELGSIPGLGRSHLLQNWTLAP